MPRVTEEYYEMKKKEIIDAAYRVCLKKPITSIEMKDVIAEAGFSHGVIYRYYKYLDEILSDMVIRINTDNRVDKMVEKILHLY
ncbi:MAG: TetR/AcrR family transcriptional regulator [Lachnospiraceae bacterium]|nr:TetR/AcrR family transcriptional regulator [Lachnospiraceae bacterium]